MAKIGPEMLGSARAVLSIEELTAKLRSGRCVLDRVSLQVAPATTTIVVGRSGAGKSTLVLAVLGLLGRAWSVSGRITFGSQSLLGAGPGVWRCIRGRGIAWVPQASALALHPSLPVGKQLQFSLQQALGLRPREARARGLNWLERVGSSDAVHWWELRPGEMSGGMNRLVLVALAFACEPALILADEPTVSLDAQGHRVFAGLLREEQLRRGMGALVVTHDIGFSIGGEDQLATMDAGAIVEMGARQAVIECPGHASTRELVAAARLSRRAFHNPS